MVSSLKELFDFCNWIVKTGTGQTGNFACIGENSKIIPPDAALADPKIPEHVRGCDGDPLGLYCGNYAA